MPRLSVWLIRASLIYLLAGFGLGALMLADEGLRFAPFVDVLLPIHIEFLLLGWLIQLAMGVAFWILPRLGGAKPRGDARTAWLSFGLLNLGILLVAAQLVTRPAVLPGRLFELAALLLFAAGSWPRVRAVIRDFLGPRPS
jgi:heme/copper-type cytochrome/quinol oxidase subunit 1